MQAWKAWEKLFNKKHIKEHYYEKIKNNPSIGLDKISPKKFDNELTQNIDIIFKKVNNGTYKFTRYKQKLFTKGANKPPRAVSIPTLRDKLTISVLNELIFNVFEKDCITDMPQVLINDILKQLSNYHYFIKLDVTSFYSSINHDILISKIKKRIKKNQIVELIIKAITTNSISYPIKEKSSVFYKDKGVPEGLAISNALANLYLLDIDKKYSSNSNIRYWRYVDDILILVNDDLFGIIKENIFNDIHALKLDFNDKKDEGEINKGFEYLGYKITPKCISVRKSSVLKMEQSLEDLVKQIKNNSIEYMQWKLNLKISGFIIDKHKVLKIL